jgi:hypothetical protein
MRRGLRLILTGQRRHRNRVDVAVPRDGGGKTVSFRGRDRYPGPSIDDRDAGLDQRNQPLIPPLLLLPFEIRLKLIATQVLQYRHMYDVDPSIERMARRVLD